MVYVIIVTFNGLKWINKCINSLMADRVVSKVIIIDNGSTDGTIEFVLNNFPQVALFKNDKNLGFGQANNQGIRIALKEGAQYVFLLNQDAWIMENAISQLVAIHNRHQEYDILSPFHLRGDGKAMDMKFGMFVSQSQNYKLLSDLYLKKGVMEDIYLVDFVNAAAWLLTRKCLETVGGFAPIYHHYGEDMDYSNRAIFHGIKFGICPSSIIYHDRINKVEYPDINKPERYFIIQKTLYLIYLTDINQNFYNRFLKLLVKIILTIFNYLFHLQFKKSAIYFKEVIMLFRLYPKVVNSNAITRKVKGAFLLPQSTDTIMDSEKVASQGIMY